MLRNAIIALLVAVISFTSSIGWLALSSKPSLPQLGYVGNGRRWDVFPNPCPDLSSVRAVVDRSVVTDERMNGWGGCHYFTYGYGQRIVAFEGYEGDLRNDEDRKQLGSTKDVSISPRPDWGPGAQLRVGIDEDDTYCMIVVPTSDAEFIAVRYLGDKRDGEMHLCYVSMALLKLVAQQA